MRAVFEYAEAVFVYMEAAKKLYSNIRSCQAAAFKYIEAVRELSMYIIGLNNPEMQVKKF